MVWANPSMDKCESVTDASSYKVHGMQTFTGAANVVLGLKPTARCCATIGYYSDYMWPAKVTIFKDGWELKRACFVTEPTALFVCWLAWDCCVGGLLGVSLGWSFGTALLGKGHGKGDE